MGCTASASFILGEDCLEGAVSYDIMKGEGFVDSAGEENPEEEGD
jgi:hypothetical protein